MRRNKPMCYPQQLGRSWNAFVPEPSGTLFAMCTGTFQNLIPYLPRNARNLISFLVRNPPEPHRPSAPEPSGTSSAICTRTRRNRVCYLHRNHLEPHQPSAPEPSGTSSAFCTGTLRNLLRNLGLQLHQIAPKLFWAKDPIASFAVGEKLWNMFFPNFPGLVGIAVQDRNVLLHFIHLKAEVGR